MPYANKADKKKYMADWWAENREQQRQYREDTKEQRSAQHRAWRLRNKEKRAADMREWRSVAENRLASNMRSRICNALQGRTKITNTFELIGASLVELRAHLESKFTPEMTWENYGRFWEVDHIRPCDSFNLSDPDQQRECFGIFNLQPLTVPKNRKKGNRYVV